MRYPLIPALGTLFFGLALFAGMASFSASSKESKCSPIKVDGMLTDAEIYFLVDAITPLVHDKLKRAERMQNDPKGVTP